MRSPIYRVTQKFFAVLVEWYIITSSLQWVLHWKKFVLHLSVFYILFLTLGIYIIGGTTTNNNRLIIRCPKHLVTWTKPNCLPHLHPWHSGHWLVATCSTNHRSGTEARSRMKMSGWQWLTDWTARHASLIRARGGSKGWPGGHARCENCARCAPKETCYKVAGLHNSSIHSVASRSWCQITPLTQSGILAPEYRCGHAAGHPKLLQLETPLIKCVMLKGSGRTWYTWVVLPQKSAKTTTSQPLEWHSVESR